jgi:hypothetical protein
MLHLDSKDINLKGHEIFLCHSPMRPIISELKTHTLLMAGLGDVHNIMKEYECSNYITVDEYLLLFPHLFSILVTEEM